MNTFLQIIHNNDLLIVGIFRLVATMNKLDKHLQFAKVT